MSASTSRRPLVELLMRRKRHAVYLVYDEDDQLLYVGMTEDLDRRFMTHAASSPWWDDAHRLVTENYDSYADAANAERAAILHQGPLFNVRRAQLNDSLPQQRAKNVRDMKSSEEAAEALRIDRSTLSRWVKRYGLRPADTTLGGHHRWDLDDLRQQLRRAKHHD